jgi:hypothetical protein
MLGMYGTWPGTCTSPAPWRPTGKHLGGWTRDGNEYIYQKRRPVRPVPGYLEQARMLTEARAEYAWLAAGA